VSKLIRQVADDVGCVFDWCERFDDRGRERASFGGPCSLCLGGARIAVRIVLEAAAAVVDECNREGPYNAIGAADRIRALLKD
jgi:hypothetical protein